MKNHWKITPREDSKDLSFEENGSADEIEYGELFASN